MNCEFSAGRFNGKCDDANNVFECSWDGGDCCGCFVEDGICQECGCKDPEYLEQKPQICCEMELMVNGRCDSKNNKADCRYDGLDCCADIASKEWNMDYACPLRTLECPVEKLMNQKCDSDLALDICLYDMGHCCDESVPLHQGEPICGA